MRNDHITENKPIKCDCLFIPLSVCLFISLSVIIPPFVNRGSENHFVNRLCTKTRTKRQEES